jgi:hypothetical protein
MHDIGVKHVETYGDSLLVVQQVPKVHQCSNSFLNACFDKCLDIILICYLSCAIRGESEG